MGVKKDLPRGYDRLRKTLTRNGVLSPGRVASLLLETFVTNEVKICVEEVERRKICGGRRGDFASWREELIQKGWLTWTKEWAYQPGFRLIPFINHEKLATKELATKKELDQAVGSVKGEVSDLRARVEILEDAVKSLIEEFDPPVTDDKIQARLRVVRPN